MIQRLTKLKKPLSLFALASSLILISSYVPQAFSVELISASQKREAFQDFVFPIVAPRLTSRFGKRIHPIKKVAKHHYGLDLAAPHKTLIRSVAEGTVVFSDTYGGYGKLLVIKHKSGFTSHYGHCSKLIAKTGDKVKPGTIIGTVGSTGHSTGPHLHFEIRHNGVAQNPEKLFPSITAKAEG